MATTERRRLLRQALATAAAALAPMLLGSARAQGPRTPMQVWKSPSCGCCAEWVKIVEAAGFAVTVHDVGNTAARQRLKVPMALGSCHTALVAGYAVEGHVPPADIRRLLAERPRAVGRAVPGRPIGCNRSKAAVCAAPSQPPCPANRPTSRAASASDFAFISPITAPRPEDRHNHCFPPPAPALARRFSQCALPP
jgi:hypothetical protein